MLFVSSNSWYVIYCRKCHFCSCANACCV